MDDRDRRVLGIRAKLNLGVGVVVLASALAFGAVYALIERATLLAEKRDHLHHVASMARLSLGGREPSDIHREISEFGLHLTQATGAPHRIWIEDAAGNRLAGSEDGADPEELPTGVEAPWGSLFPATMVGEVPIEMGSASPAARLVVEESLEGLSAQTRAAFLRHLGFAIGLFGLTALAVSRLAHVLVVRPVRQLATATERIGDGAHWEPYSPSVRRNDEIGVLCDRFAELSRRLLSLVRDERYGSAHLVTIGIERALDEPIRQAQLELAVLQASLPAGSDEAERCVHLAGNLEEIVELARRFKELGDHPPGARPKPA